MRNVLLGLYVTAVVCILIGLFGGCARVEYVSGPQGPKGDAGANGAGCEVSEIGIGAATPNGGSLITCPGGSALIQNGAPGAEGAQGIAGAPGANGVAYSAIQFCPGVSAPTAEVGFCMNGTLFAVYWDQQNAWLAEIVPGNYRSTSTGAACSFTVGPSCQVTN